MARGACPWSRNAGDSVPGFIALRCNQRADVFAAAVPPDGPARSVFQPIAPLRRGGEDALLTAAQPRNAGEHEFFLIDMRCNPSERDPWPIARWCKRIENVFARIASRRYDQGTRSLAMRRDVSSQSRSVMGVVQAAAAPIALTPIVLFAGSVTILIGVTIYVASEAVDAVSEAQRCRAVKEQCIIHCSGPAGLPAPGGRIGSR
jgi:hypothetical protein